MKRNQETIHRVRIYGAWAWKKEEEWLNRMASKGWLMTDVTFLVYTFRRVKPGTDWIYQLDYNELRGEDLEDYKEIFADAGWKYITNFASWHYFRANADEVSSPTIHTNNESRIKMLWKVMRLLLIAGMPSYIWLMTTGRFMQTYIESGTFTWADVLMILVITLVLIIAYAILRLGLAIRKLKAQGKE